MLMLIISLFFFFFFSSRRRHTRWPRDWSSDVCSSDLDTCRVAGSPADRARESLGVRNESREDRGQVSRSKVSRQELGEQIAEVGGHGHVPALEALRGIESGPLAQDPASVHWAAQHQHGRRVPVIGARAAVFPYGATEL